MVSPTLSKPCSRVLPYRPAAGACVCHCDGGAKCARKNLHSPRYLARIQHQVMIRRQAEFRRSLDLLIKFMEEQQPRLIGSLPGTVRSAQDELNQSRSQLLDNITTGRVHIGKWTLHWYALRRFFNRIWRHHHVD